MTEEIRRESTKQSQAPNT